MLCQLSYSRNPNVECKMRSVECKMRGNDHSQFRNFHFESTKVGRGGFEPPKVKTGRFTVCCVWPLRYRPRMCVTRHKNRGSPLFSIGIIECEPRKVARVGVEFQMKPFLYILQPHTLQPSATWHRPSGTSGGSRMLCNEPVVVKNALCAPGEIRDGRSRIQTDGESLKRG